MSGTRTTTTNLRSGSPAGRGSKLSARSNSSVKSSGQASDVSDLLSVAPAAKGKRNKLPLPTGVQTKNQLHNSSGNKRNVKPKLSQSLNVAKAKSSPEKKKNSKPAWAIKPAVDDDTPRDNVSVASTFTLPARPSLNDFLDFPEDDQNIHLSTFSMNNTDKLTSGTKKAETKKSFLEYLADTNRTDLTDASTMDNTGTFRVTSDEKPPDCWTSNLKDGDELEMVNGFSDADSDNFRIVKDFNDYDTFNCNDDRDKKYNDVVSTNLDKVPSSTKDDFPKSVITLNNASSAKTKTKMNNSNNVKNGTTLSSKPIENKSNHKLKKEFDTCKNSFPSNLEKQISFLEKREIAAKTIQIWWRKTKIRRTAGAAAMRRMMQNKQKQLESKLSMERQKELDKQAKEYEQMKRREDKARAARQNVITEMQNKRVSKEKSKEKTKKQMKISPSNGRPFTQKLNNSKASPQTLVNNLNAKSFQSFDEKQTVLPSPRPSTSSSVTRKIEEIFEASTKDGNSTLVDSTPGIKDDDSTVVLDEVKASSKSTYDDLLNTIKELEGDTISTSMADLWGANKDSKRNETLSIDYLEKLSTPETVPAVGSYLTTDKLNSIISFLDEVEKVEEDVRSEVLRQSKEANLTEVENCIDQLSLHGGQDSVMDSASQVATDISNAIVAKKQEINEKKRSLEMMKKAMGQQKEFATMQMIEMDKEHKQQLKIQRQEYEGTIQRHLAFIDQLIDDKKVLTERCEGLVSKLKDIDQKYSNKIKQMEDSHTVELKKQKEIGEAAEKLRREKWIKEKTQEIKEITVKGLEPDIQKLIAKHKAEIKKIKAMKQGEVLDADERVGRKYIQQIEDVRAQLQKEKEVAVRKERDNARERFESQMMEEEKAFQQQRRRLYQEIEEEKERCAEQMQKYKKECDERLSGMEASFKQTASLTQGDHEKQMQDIQRNHEVEMNNYKDQVDIEKQQWIENYMKKQETQLLSKERELKEGVREARDKEIEMVITRLEQEATASREESEKAAENRIKRIRDKYEKEIKELEQSEKTVQEKYNAIKERMADADGDQIKLKSECKQKDQEISDLKKITDRLQEERGKVTDIIRQEFADRLVVLEEESKRLRNELSEEKARHKFDVDKMTTAKEEEMEELHKRVKKAVANKDENSKLLRQQLLAAEKRAEHLEQLLAEQRKKLLAD